MIITFEILREAGVRLPKPVGSAVSIVGALVLGESAVSAGLIGPFMVIIVAITAIASFVVPSQTDSMAVLRYGFLVLAALAGGFGVLMGVLVVLIHIASLRSFGAPFLFPFSSLSLTALRDTFVRTPLKIMSSHRRTGAGANTVGQTSCARPTSGKKRAGSGDVS